MGNREASDKYKWNLFRKDNESGDNIYNLKFSEDEGNKTLISLALVSRPFFCDGKSERIPVR